MSIREPFAGVAPERWKERTLDLIAAHPLDPIEIVDVVTASRRSIFSSKIGSKGFKIGKDIFPKPQILGFLLHELILLELASRHPQAWRVDSSGADKDLVYVPDAAMSVEIKTSSHAHQVFGNRSYAQPSPTSRKTKAGYGVSRSMRMKLRLAIRPCCACCRLTGSRNFLGRLCDRLNTQFQVADSSGRYSKLIAVGEFLLDYLAIHPFDDEMGVQPDCCLHTFLSGLISGLRGFTVWIR